MFITFKIHYLRHADHTLCRVHTCTVKRLSQAYTQTTLLQDKSWERQFLDT